MSLDTVSLDTESITIDWFKQNVTGFETNEFFTSDWFSNGLINFEYVKQKITAPPESILEIGCHEGRSTCWMLKNLLSSTGTITCIDPFAHAPLNAFDNQQPPPNRIIEQIFCHNTDLAKLPDQQIRLMPTLSFYALAQLITEKQQFDFVYVDGSHSADAVLADAVMAFGLLKPKGFMIFDDYLWKDAANLLDRPKMSIDAFVNMFQNSIEVIMINYQYVIQKV